MYHALLVQLHYSFVADSQLHAQSSAMALKSFAVCATAADSIVQLLRVYDRIFSVRQAPYLISYVTYVSATVLVRVATQKLAGSKAHECLRTCIAVLHENQATNWGVRSAIIVIQDLMKRMKVDCGDSQLSIAAQSTSQTISVTAPSGLLSSSSSQYESHTNAKLSFAMEKDDHIEPKMNIDSTIQVQNFAEDCDGEVQSVNSVQGYFRVPTTAYPLEDDLGDNGVYGQMFLDCEAMDFGFSAEIGQNTIGEFGTSKPFF